MSQEDAILKYLEAGYSLTPIEALQLFGCFRLGARVWDLRRAGVDVRSRTIKDNGKHFSQYFLPGQMKML